MSTAIQPAQGQQMDGDQAYQTLFDQVYVPVFLEKLANVYSIKPQTQGDLDQLLGMAGKLRHAEDTQQTKQADDRAGFLAQANAGLDQLMGGSGMAPKPDDTIIKQAAQQAAQNPQLRQAALDYQNAIALEMAQQQAAS